MQSLQYEKVPSLVHAEGQEEAEVEELRGEGEGAELDLLERGGWARRVSHMVALSLPACASLVLTSLNNFILMYFAGHLDKYSLSDDTIIFAGISLANMYANVTGFAFLTGMSTAVETLASQQNGSKRYEEVGITFLRSMLVLGSLALPIAASWHYVGSIFMFFRVDDSICAVMEEFLRVRKWSLPADVLNFSFSRYLMAMGVMKPAMYTALLNSVVLFIVSWIVTAPRWGIDGNHENLAWAFVLSTFAGALALVFISWKLKEVKRTLIPLFRSGVARTVWNMNQLKLFIALGLPGCAMTCSEWWAFEILTVFASRLGAVAVSAQSIMLQLCVVAFMVPLGISSATASMVGNALGAHRKHLAIELSNISLSMMFCLEIVFIGPLILYYGSTFVAIFTEDSNVVDEAEHAVHMLAILVVGDGMQGVAGGVMRGAGKQMTGATVNIITYYCLGLPIAWLLCFHTNMGISGLLLGISLGAATQGVTLIVLIVYFQSWIFTTTVVDESGKSPVVNHKDRIVCDENSALLNNGDSRFRSHGSSNI